MPRAIDPRNLLKKTEGNQEEEVQWSERIEEFDIEHIKHVWDLAFSESFKTVLAFTQRGTSLEDRMRYLAKQTKIALEYADVVIQVYAEHRKNTTGVFVSAVETLNSKR